MSDYFKILLSQRAELEPKSQSRAIEPEPSQEPSQEPLSRAIEPEPSQEPSREAIKKKTIYKETI